MLKSISYSDLEKKNFSKEFGFLYLNSIRFFKKYFQDFHNLKFSNKDCEILIGSWLIVYIRYYQTFFYEDNHNKENENQNKSINKNISTTYSYEEFNRLISSNFEFRNMFKYLIKYQNFDSINFNDRQRCHNKGKINFLHYFYRFLRRKNDNVIYSIHKSRFEMFKIFLKLKQMPIEKIQSFKSNSNFDKSKRLNIFRKNIDIFKILKYEKFFLFFKIAIYLLPKNYLESFKQNIENIKKIPWPEKPNYILSSFAHITSDEFKFYYYLKKKEYDIPFYLLPHGGGYTFSKYGHKHLFEYRVCDKFLSWGNEIHKKYSNKQEIFGCHRFRKIKKIWPKKNFIVSIAMPDLMRSQHSIYGKNPERSLEKCIKILNSLCLKNKKIIFQPVFYGSINDNNLNKELRDGVLKLNNINSNYIYNHSNYPESLKYNSLAIVIYNSTSLYLNFYSNTPFLIYNHDRFFDYNEKYQFLINQFKDAGLYFDNIDKLNSELENLNKNYHKIVEWWFSNKIQKCIVNFQNMFVKESKFDLRNV